MAHLETAIVREIPKRPKSEVFAYRHVLDRFDLERMKNDPEFLRYLKGRMARSLADHIVEVCQLFEPPAGSDLMRGHPIQMECTINDRGSYENWIPVERDRARVEGVKIGAKRVRDSIPYGFEPGMYYE